MATVLPGGSRRGLLAACLFAVVGGAGAWRARGWRRPLLASSALLIGRTGAEPTPSVEFDVLDADGDGRLSESEYLNAFPDDPDIVRDQLAKNFARADINGDRSLSSEEYLFLSYLTPGYTWKMHRKCQMLGPGSCDEVSRLFDRVRVDSGDGISKADLFEALRESLRIGKAEFRQEWMSTFQHFFEIADVARDGKLTLEELEFFKEAFLQASVAQALQKQVHKFFREHDGDGDGKLSEEEVLRMASHYSRSEAHGRIAAYTMRHAFPGLDADGDGGLDTTEALALMELLYLGYLL